MTQKKNISNKA